MDVCTPCTTNSPTLHDVTMVFSGRRMLACYRHELRTLIHSPINVIFLSGFLIAMGLCIFLIGEFFSTDETSLTLWTLFLPWCGLVFVPALAMRAWPYDHTDHSVELSLTLPLSIEEIVIAKFLSGVTLTTVTLILTLPFPATLAYLGEPDWGVVLAGYLAAFLLLALYFSIALAVAAILGDGISSYLASVVFLFILILGGADELSSLVDEWIPFRWIQGLKEIFPGPHYKLLASGLVEWRAVSWFLLAMTAMLACCGLAIHDRRKGSSSLQRKLVLFVKAMCVLAVSVFGQLISSQISLEADLTEQKIYTLSQATLRALQGVEEVVKIDLYWSQREKTVPQSIRNYADSVRHFLQRVASNSNERVKVTHIDPVPDTNAELKALEAGIKVVPMTSGDYFYLGLEISYAGKRYQIPYLDVERAGWLESDVLSALLRFTSRQPISVGILSPLTPPGTLDAPRPGLSFIEELKPLHDVSIIPFFAESLPADLDVLLVLQGTVLKRKMLWAIDQFVMSGGTLIAAMDPMVRFDRSSNELRFQPSETINDLSDLILAWGVRYEGSHIVGDRNLSSPVQTTDTHTPLNYPYWLGFSRNTLDSSHPVTAALQNILIVEAGSLKTVPTTAHIVPLLRTTEEAGFTPRDTYRNYSHFEHATRFSPETGRQLIAALIHRPLISAYQGREIPVGHAGIQASVKPANVFVIADVDWLFDPFALHTTHMGSTTLTRPLNDNIPLLANMIAHSQNAVLADVPVRSNIIRRFTRIARMYHEVEQDILVGEQLTLERMAEFERKLDVIRETAQIDSLAELPSPLREQALPLQRKLIEMKRDLRNIRQQMRTSVDQLEVVLILINLISAPAMVIMLAVWVAFQRRYFPTRWISPDSRRYPEFPR